MALVKKTGFLAAGGQLIKSVMNKGKKIFFINKGGKRVYGRKAARRVKSKIGDVMNVPKGIRNKNM